MAFVAAAPAALAIGVAHADVDDGALVLASVAEVDGDPPRPCGNLKRDFAIGLVVGAGDLAGERDLAWRLLRCERRGLFRRGGARRQYEQEREREIPHAIASVDQSAA
jgi:hypothetical protein